MVLKSYKVKFGKSGEESFSTVGIDKDFEKPAKEPDVPKYGYGRKVATVPVKRGGKVFYAKRQVGRKLPQRTVQWNMSPKMDNSLIINKENPLASVSRHTGDRIHKISVNLKTNELAMSTSTMDSHALIQANYGAKGKEEKSADWARGIYDARHNVIGIRVPDSLEYNYGEETTDEEVMAKAIDYQLDIYERLVVNNPSLKVCFNLTNNDLNRFYESFDASNVDPKRIYTLSQLFPKDSDAVEMAVNPYSLAITPNRKKYATTEQVAPIFKTRKFKEWNQNLFDLSKRLDVNVDDLWESVGRWQEEVEPSFMTNLSDSKKNIFKIGCMLGKKYHQDSVMFVKADINGKQAIAEIKLRSESDLNTVHKILTEQGYPGSSITVGASSLVVGLLSDEDKANIGKLVKRLESNGVLESGDYNIHPAEITFVGSDDYDRYIKGGVAHV